MSVTFGIYFDTRSIRKKTNTYPYKLWVRYAVTQTKPEYYPTIYGLSAEDHNKLTAKRLGPELLEIRDKLDEIERIAANAIKVCDPFSFEEFESEFITGNPHFEQTRLKVRTVAIKKPDFDWTPFFKKFPILKETPEPGTIGDVYQSIIKKKLMRGKIGTAASYQSSYVSMVKFGGNVKFQVITDDYLFLYTEWMKKDGNTKTTIGMYTRALRAVFNEADAQKVIKKEKCYPFGKRKFVIPSTRNIKKALDIEDVEAIYNYAPDPQKPWLQKAKDFWLFSYFGNGINPKDICNLTWKQITGDFLEFERVKTEETLKSDPPKISIFLDEDLLQIIGRWGNIEKDPDNYIFPIYERGMSPLREYEVSLLFIKFINKWMRVILADLGIKKKSTTYVARHTFSTIQRRAGASVDDIQELLGQVDPMTTKRYVASLESEQKRIASSRLSAFKRNKNPEKAA